MVLAAKWGEVVAPGLVGIDMIHFYQRRKAAVYSSRLTVSVCMEIHKLNGPGNDVLDVDAPRGET